MMRTMRGRYPSIAASALVLFAVVVLPGCGSGSDDRPALVVTAAASLKKALSEYDDKFEPAQVRASFGPSDELAAQIESGVRPDVYAAANTELPENLYRRGLVGKPLVFASNRLVIAVRSGSSRIKSLDDLARPGTKLGIASPSVPIGKYTRKILDRLPEADRKAILANARTNEPDASSLVGKVVHGSIDAALVYLTDVAASGERLKSVALPKQLQPRVAYAVAVVKGARRPELAERYVNGLLSGAGRRALDDAGFEPPPLQGL